MHRQQQQNATDLTRSPGREEWERSPGEQEHQMEAREHARPARKAHKVLDARRDEAEQQVRELRARY